MTNLAPTGHDLVRWALSISTWLTAGVLIGAFHFLTLRWNVGLFAARRALLLAAGVQFFRFALVTAVLVAVTRSCGAIPLLLATVGIWTSRTAIVRLGV